MDRKDIKVILFDLDGTLTKDVCWTEDQCLNATPNKEEIEFERELAKDNYIVIYTARKDDLLSASVKWLKKHDIPFQAISNLKASADYYYDDKAYNIRDKNNFKKEIFGDFNKDK